MNHPKLLRFSLGNAKLDKEIAVFNLPSGHTCPGAEICLAKVPRQGGSIKDGSKAQHRCYSATAELMRPNVRASRWRNMDLLKEAAKKGGATEMSALILDSLRPFCERTVSTVRLHGAGDFFSQAYFDAWMVTALRRKDLLVYAYTKSIHFVRDWVITRGLRLPENFRLNMSHGGKFETYRKELSAAGYATCFVVDHPEKAEAMGIEVDHDDSHAIEATKDFALLLHGTQPAGSDSAKSLVRMRKEGIKFSYSHTDKK